MSAVPTWRDLAVLRPEFVQWVVARFGPLPDGPVTQNDYERFAAAYSTPDEVNDGPNP